MRKGIRELDDFIEEIAKQLADKEIDVDEFLERLRNFYIDKKEDA